MTIRFPLAAWLAALQLATPLAPLQAAEPAPPDSARAGRAIERLFRPDRVRVRAQGTLVEYPSWTLEASGLAGGSRGASPMALHAWNDIDTLWARENVGRSGALTTGLMLGAVAGLMGLSVGNYVRGIDSGSPDPGVMAAGGFAIGGLAGLVVGGAFGSLGRRWVRLYPETTSAPRVDRRSRRRE